MDQSVVTLKNILQPVRAGLDRVEAILREELASENPFVGALLEHSTKFHGKRVRPALLLHCAHIFGDPSNLHFSLAAVVEMLHNATLVHDDVLDEAKVRRRVETLNHVWGNEASILFGDYLFAKAYALCARLHNREANGILSRTIEDMCVGELSQIATKFNFDIDEERYLEIIHHKTAALFATACRLGSVGLDADPAAVDALARYGTCFGMAFQIIDDCLDLTGDEDVAGKSLGTDLEKGKLTLPVIRLLRGLPPSERRMLEDLISGRAGVADRRSAVLNLIREHDILDPTLERAMGFVKDAKKALSGIRDSVYVGNLHHLADFVLERRA